MTRYNDTDTCDECRKSLFKGLREYDKNNNWTGRWLCPNCHQKYSLSSQHNMMKSLANVRTGNIRTNSEQEKGILTQELTNRWKNIKDLNIINDNYRNPIDHTPDKLGFVYQTKSKWYDPVNRNWASRWISETNKQFDYLILYCVSKDGKKIERIYIFPKVEVTIRSGITIVKDPMNTSGKLKITPWYEQYRVIDEEILKEVNKIWTNILEAN